MSEQCNSETFSHNQIRNGEEVPSARCKVTGSIPSWLGGSVIRNGPGEFEVGEDKFKHWFDGHALLHKFDITNGEVYYTSKFIQSESYKTNHKHKRIVISGFGTPSIPDPCKNVFARFFSKFLSTPPTFDNCTVNVSNLKGAYYATTDAAVAYRIEPKSLDTKEFIQLNKASDLVTNTAHPHYDYNGDYYNLSGSFGPFGYYAITKIERSSMINKEEPLLDFSVVAKIPIGDIWKPSYFHSFGMSENYFIVHDQPVRLVATKVMKASFTWEGVMSAFEHQKDRESIFHIVDKKSCKPLSTKFVAKGRFSFHHVNSYEEKFEGKTFLVVDMMCSEGVTFFWYWMKILKSGPEKRKQIPKMWPLRFVLPLDVSKETAKGTNLVTLPGCQATAEIRDDGSIFLIPELLLTEEIILKLTCKGTELPQINYDDVNQRKYKYFYCVGEDECAFPSQLMKVDVETKDALQWKEENRFPSEPIFVKRPSSTEEDDGVVLSTVLSADPKDGIFLLILDARTFTEVARAEVKAKLPLPVHGCFIPAN